MSTQTAPEQQAAQTCPENNKRARNLSDYFQYRALKEVVATCDLYLRVSICRQYFDRQPTRVPRFRVRTSMTPGPDS